MTPEEKRFHALLFILWRKLGLAADVLPCGNRTYCCPGCNESLMIAFESAQCLSCKWNAKGTAAEIARAAKVKSGADISLLEPRFVDLGALVRAGLPKELPTFVPTFGDKCLFYPGRLNEIHAEPSVGKTNVGCAAAASEIRGGGKVAYLDPEDTPRGIAAKLVSFGLSDTELSEAFYYVHNPEPADYDAVQFWCMCNPCSLVILDGLAESLAAENLNEDVPGDILQFFRQRLRPFAEAGAAVLISDHVAKNQ
jgi:hypothetical protein